MKVSKALVGAAVILLFVGPAMASPDVESDLAEMREQMKVLQQQVEAQKEQLEQQGEQLEEAQHRVGLGGVEGEVELRTNELLRNFLLAWDINPDGWCHPPLSVSSEEPSHMAAAATAAMASRRSRSLRDHCCIRPGST